MTAVLRALAIRLAYRLALGLLLWTVFYGLLIGDTFAVQAATVGLVCAAVAYLNLRNAMRMPARKEGGRHSA